MLLSLLLTLLVKLPLVLEKSDHFIEQTFRIISRVECSGNFGQTFPSFPQGEEDANPFFQRSRPK